MADDDKPIVPAVVPKNLTPWTKETAPRWGSRPRSQRWSTREMRKAWDESGRGGRRSLLETVLSLAAGEGCDPKTQLEAIKFAWKIAHGEFKKQLDDSAAQKIAEQLFAQAIAQAEERRRIAETNATEIETKGTDDGEKGE